MSHYIFNLLGRFSIVFSVHSQIFSFHMILVQWANSVVLIIVMTNFDQLSYDWFLVREIRLWKVRVSNRRELTWLYYYDNRAGETGGEGRGAIPPPHFFAKKRKEQKGQRDRESMKKEKKVIFLTNNNPFLMKQRQDSAHDIRKNNRNNNFILLTFFSMYFCLSFYSLAA